MRVGPKHGTDSPIEEVPHRLLVASRFGMQVYATDADLGRDLLEDLLDGLKGAIDRTHKDASEQTDHSHGDSRLGLYDAEGLARCLGRKVRRFDDVLSGREDLLNLAFLVDVVPEGDRIDPRRNELLVLLGRQPGPFSCVLRIDDDQIAGLLSQHTDHRADDGHPRLADDISDMNDPNRFGRLGREIRVMVHHAIFGIRRS